jgi:hypothetical protein
VHLALVTRSTLTVSGLAAALFVAASLDAAAQTAAADRYQPITGAERAEWVVGGSLGVRSLAVGVFTSTFLTAVNDPEEWQRSWSGFGKRYGSREATVTISNSVEAGVGSLWGEDPRYDRRGRGRVWHRIGHALKAGVTARGRDGRLHPAWARYGGVVTSHLVARTWLPPSATTTGATTWRMSGAVLGRMAGNAFEEFWPDVRERFRK